MCAGTCSHSQGHDGPQTKNLNTFHFECVSVAIWTRATTNRIQQNLNISTIPTRNDGPEWCNVSQHMAPYITKKHGHEWSSTGIAIAGAPYHQLSATSLARLRPVVKIDHSTWAAMRQ